MEVKLCEDCCYYRSGKALGAGDADAKNYFCTKGWWMDAKPMRANNDYCGENAVWFRKIGKNRKAEQ